MTRYPRYAIYYAPAPGDRLHGFGSHLLGYDAFSGSEVAFPDGLPADWREVTQDPRRYGFHATLKAPFSLAPDQSEAELHAACKEFAAMARRIPVIEPVIAAIEGFVAIVPGTHFSGLVTLARDCVADFDHFRAPLMEHDRQRRNPSSLSARQFEYLERWGYPYVMEEFRFHMTLTGRLSSPQREAVVATLSDRFSTLDLRALAIDRIALFRQDDAAARFRALDQFALCSSAPAYDPIAPQAAATDR